MDDDLKDQFKLEGFSFGGMHYKYWNDEHGFMTKRAPDGVYYYRWKCGECGTVMVYDENLRKLCPACGEPRGRIETRTYKKKKKK
jgi:rubrerythrin